MGLLKGQSIIESQQFTAPGVLQEFEERVMFYENLLKRGERGKCLEGRAGVLEFYEPSTRTRMSFERAIQLLGGRFSFTEDAGKFSSAAKGERLEHSVRVLSGYHLDFIILRHSHDNAAELARNYLEARDCKTLVINAGCGMGQHPSQALVDWWTVRKKKRRTNNLRILIAGDLARGRTARSLAYLFGREDGVQIDFVSPPQLRMEDDIISYLKKHGVTPGVYGSLDEVLGLADVVYLTRVQKERPHPKADLSDIDLEPFRMTVARAKSLKPDAHIMHPLPIFDEVEAAVDDMPCAIYFEQSDNGVPVRMALLDMILC